MNEKAEKKLKKGMKKMIMLDMVPFRIRLKLAWMLIRGPWKKKLREK